LRFACKCTLKDDEASSVRIFHTEALLPALADIIDEVTTEGVATVVNRMEETKDCTEALAIAESAVRKFFQDFREHQQSRIEYRAIIAMANRLQDTRCFKPLVAEPASEVLISMGSSRLIRTSSTAPKS
jgi:hypothetical protein